MLSLRSTSLAGSLLVFLVLFATPSIVEADFSTEGPAPSLPGYLVPAPPIVVIIPNTYVYYVPDIDIDIFFYQGHWYRPYEGHWFKSQSYNGPWGYTPPHRIPPALIGLPPHYKQIPPGYHRIPYGQLKKHWSRWERHRYWYQGGWND